MKENGVVNFEEYFKNVNGNKLCLVKTWNLGLYSRLCVMSSIKSGLDLSFVNAYETHAAENGKVKAKGSILLTNNELMKRFGCDYLKMS